MPPARLVLLVTAVISAAGLTVLIAAIAAPALSEGLLFPLPLLMAAAVVFLMRRRP